MRWISPLLLLIALNSAVASIGDLIAAGKYPEALDTLQADYYNGNNKQDSLFIYGLTDQSGDNSVAFLKDYVNQNPNTPYLSDWARLTIGKYYLAQNLDVVARKQFEEINSNSTFGPEASFLAARCFLLAGEYAEGIKPFQSVIDNLAGKKSKGKPISPNYYYYWAILGQAEAKMLLGKYSESEKLYDQLLEPDLEDDIFPLALLDLAQLSQKIGKPEKVDHYLNLYKDQYGSLPISSVSKFEQQGNQSQTESSIDEQTDKILNNKYFIQIGAYSKKSNADKSAAIYRKSGYRAMVEEYTNQGQKYYRVFLGSYSSKREANFVKERLEKASGEKYTLLVR